MAKVTFRIHYGTQWGENLLFERRFLAGHEPAARTEILPMHATGDGYWTWSLDSVEPGECIEYRYVFRDERGDYRREPVFRQIGIVGASQWVVDEWLPPELPDMAFLRQAFAGTIFNPARKAGSRKGAKGQRTLKLTLRAPRVMKGCRICVSGSSPWLGNWDRAGALVMAGNHYPLWQADIPVSDILSPVEFKFGLWSEREACLVHLEAGPNRQLRGLPNDQESVVYNCAYFRYGKRWKGAGVAIPVFSLRSETGYGIGELTDLERFAEWAAGCGMHLVQILPVNDTTSDNSWKDSYPYNAISAMALHPICISVQNLYEQYRLPLPEDYCIRRDALNRLPQLDYEAVLKDKWAYLRQFHAQAGAQALRSRGFKAFYKSYGHWLKPYAAFCRLRDRFSTADFTCWGEYAAYEEATIDSWFAPGAPEYDEVMLHCLVQFHLEQQLHQAMGAGRARGVAFKGDLPIGIGRCSVEAWTEPELFHADRQTGAPPDAFGELGQNWGFPTYHWQKMAGDDYAW